jgi:hypothetical protein
MDHTSTDGVWVEDRMRALAADDRWEPDAIGASGRFHVRRRRAASVRRRALWLAPVVAAAMAILIASVPSTRAAAQRLWTMLQIDRTAIVPVRSGSSVASLKSFQLELLSQPTTRHAIDTRMAAQLAGFAPRLIRSPALGSATDLSVASEFRGRVTLHRDELLEAARRMRPAVFVPHAWDGVRLEIEQGPTVIATWPNVVLLQTEPPRVRVPDDFDLQGYAVVGLRILGLSERDARRLADESKNLPAVLATGSEDRVRRVTLGSGVSGTLLHDIGQRGILQSRILHWSSGDRLFVLTVDARCGGCVGYTDDLLVSLAASVR